MTDEQKLTEAHKMIAEAVRLEKEALTLRRKARALLSPPAGVGLPVSPS